MPIKIKDHGKCKEWERRRRDRLNDAFKNLAQLLPHYDPAKIPAKIEILEKSTEFVKELRLSNSRLLSNQAETDEKCKLIKELQDEVNKLILRVKQLTILLKKANITIPTGPEIKSLGSKRHKWSGKLKPQDVENAVIVKSNGNSKPHSISLEKANNGTAPSTENEPASTVPDISSQGDHNGIKTNNTAINTSVASIIVPLKEANLTRSTACNKSSSSSSSGAKVNTTQVKRSTIATASIIPKPISPTTATATTLATTTSPSILSSPAKLIATPESIFTTATTTPLQLPLQTFIITPCSITGTAQATPLSAQNPQIVTRIANILPAPILPKSFESLSLQKIPIKSLLKPIPKVIKRRKRKKKNAILSEITIKQKSEGASTDKVQNVNAVVVPTDSPVGESSSKKTDTVTSPSKEKSVEEVTPLLPTTPVVSPEKATKDISVLPVEELKNKVPEENITTSAPAPALVELTEEQGNKNENKESHVKESVITNGKTDKLTESETDVSKQTIPIIDLLKPVNESEKPPDDVIIIAEEKSKETSDNVEDITETEEHPPTQDIPVLRIIEASSSLEGTCTDILSTIHVDNCDDKIKETSTESLQDVANDKEKVSTAEQSKVAEDEAQQSEKMQVDDDILEIPVPADPCQTSIEIPPVSKGAESSITEPPVPSTTAEKEAEVSEASQQDFERVDDITEQLGVFDQTSNQVSTTTATISSQNDEVVAPIPAIEKSPDSHSEGLHESVASTNQPIEAVSTMPSAVDNHNNDQLAEIESIHQAQPEPLAPLENLSVAPTATETSVLTSLDTEKDNGSKGKTTSARTEPELPNRTTTRHKEKDMMDTTITNNSMSTTDKISECIARSIDLIDANDSELMELGEHWEDNGASPKSISPTQIFLNIFPLLPRESSTSEPQQQQSTSIPSQHPSTFTSSQASKNTLPFLPTSSNSRSSFFIDAMLPDDHSGSASHAAIVNDSTDLNTLSAHSPFLPLTPPQYSSNIVNQQISNPFSLSNNYYWTPPTVPSSSSNNLENAATECRSTSSSNYPQNESHRTSASLSNVETTTTTANSSFSTVSTPKTLTNPTTILNPPASVPSVVVSVKSSTTLENQRSSKRSKSTVSSSSSSSTGKLAFNFDTGAPAFSKNKSLAVTSTTTKTSTPTTISVTWALTGPTTTQTSTFHPSTATPFHNAPETNVHFSSTNSSTSGGQVSHHSCSLLDSLNPMDAAFFRPLMNALDSHDFRSLDFSGNTSLPPPPPPLPPLIPPPPGTCKSLYTSQFGTNSQPVVQSSVGNPTFLDHATSSTSIQGSFIHHHHHHQPVQMFGNNLQQLTVPDSIIQQTNTSTSTSTKHQDSSQTQQQQNLANVSQTNQKPHSSNGGAKVASGPDKTSRTSGRQKSESSKTKSRSGKSSRTQPYIVPSSSHASTESSNSKPNQGVASTTTTTPQKSSSSHSYPFHTIQSHINSCSTKPTGAHSSRSHDFQMENLHSSSLHFETTEMQNFSKINPLLGSGNHSSHNNSVVERAQLPKTLESKSHKNKDEKLQNYNSSKSTKQSAKSSRNDFTTLPAPSFSSQSLNTVRPTNATLHTQGKTSAASSQTTATIRASAQQEPVKTTMQNTHTGGGSNVGLMQPFQTPHSALEPFQLFPEFNAAANSRQFSAPAHSHHHHYSHHHTHENSNQSMPLQQTPSSAAVATEQQSAATNFNVQPVHRSHPYYFPDIASSFGENFQAMPVSVHVHQPQPQSHLPSSQVLNSGNNNKQSTSNANSAHSIQGLSQGTDNNASKFTYASNSNQQTPLAQIPPPHQEYHQIHVPQQQQQQQLHQKTSRHHHNNPFAPHHDTPHPCNQQTSVPLQQTPSSTTSASNQQSAANQRHHAQQPCQQQNVPQTQNRHHHSHSSTVTTTTTSTAPVSSAGKGKQQVAPPTPFHAPQHPTQQHHQTSNQHHQQIQLQNTQHHQQQQNVSQPHHHPNRSSSSKTVNWMTDTGYRPSNSASTSSAATATTSKHQQRQSSSVSTSNPSNPFSVSKLVGSSTASTTPSKPQQSHNNSADAVVNTRGQQQLQQVQPLAPQNCGHNSNVARSNKSARNTGTTVSSIASVPAPPPPATNNNQSQNQSSYCAEALIRKNPPVQSVDWTNEFNLVPASNNHGVQATGYASSIGHHHSNPHAHHHHHTAGAGPEHFPNYPNASATAPYQYPTGGVESHVSASTSSQFSHFDHSQSQYQTTQHHHQHHHLTPAAQSTSSNNYNTTVQGQQRQHNPQTQSSQNQSSGQMHYPHQHHYPHHSSHHAHHQQHSHGSTSSVTNFNLSTIFPEINDKRNNNPLGGGHGRSASGNNSADVSSRGSGSAGNMNSACSYHHSNFGNQPSGNLH